jgi:molybdate transport system regulatory protein
MCIVPLQFAEDGQRLGCHSMTRSHRRACWRRPRRSDPPLDTPTMDTKLTLRVDLGNGRALGPGKIRLLEAIARTGSISQAGRKLGMSYRRAWLLVDDMNGCFDDPVIEAQPGGAHGGGATLTSFGQKLIELYRAIEADALVATRKHMLDIDAALKAAKASRPPTSLKRAVRGTAARGDRPTAHESRSR